MLSKEKKKEIYDTINDPSKWDCLNYGIYRLCITNNLIFEIIMRYQFGDKDTYYPYIVTINPFGGMLSRRKIDLPIAYHTFEDAVTRLLYFIESKEILDNINDDELIIK